MYITYICYIDMIMLANDYDDVDYDDDTNTKTYKKSLDRLLNEVI